jgi:predicted TIM-barrel fold metal-dependent hydrolase
VGAPAGSFHEELSAVGLVDHHAHGILRLRPTLDEFRGLHSESHDPSQWPHVATGLAYRRAMRELAAHLGCEPTEEAVHARRLASDFDEYAASLLQATGTDLLLVDDGYPPSGEGESVGWDELGALAACTARPVMRIERVAEEALAAELSLAELRAYVREAVSRARADGFAALKTIAAYRTGLDIGPPDVAAAVHALAAHTRRLEAKPLLELLLWDALEANAADPLPVQLHAGFGDADLFLPAANPALLKPLVEHFPQTPFVLLHCYPYVREAGWLAHVYGNVWLDLSLTVPRVSRPVEMVRQALELAPVSKLVYGSDGSRTPELFLLAAVWWRQALAEVLAEALSPGEAEQAGRSILRDNAIALYGLGELVRESG